jgi:hypothetical protein
MKKVLHWLFRKELDLDKKLGHRLVKVIFLCIFFLSYLGGLAYVFFDVDMEWLKPHNTKIVTSLYDYTVNYKDSDAYNTIKPFFKEADGDIGVQQGNKMLSVYDFQLDKSVCLKNPSKYTGGIALYYHDSLSYIEQQKVSTEQLIPYVEQALVEDPERRCFFFQIYDDDLKKVEHLSKAIVVYKPNILYYVEGVLRVTGIALIALIAFILFYYRVILYVFYGGKAS